MVKMSFQPSSWGLFGKKKQRTLNVGKIRKYDEESVILEEKTFLSFKSAFLPNWEGAKYAVGGRPFCINIRLLSIKLILSKNNKKKQRKFLSDSQKVAYF